MLPRDTPKYNGSAKSEDFIFNNTTVVGIAWGNKRMVVHYVPVMLLGSTWTWLYSLPTAASTPGPTSRKHSCAISSASTSGLDAPTS
ncbi:Endoglucanase 3 [Hordeum vulgare]|nr:Endoglucanase 3 [Hordeum vulgare]